MTEILTQNLARDVMIPDGWRAIYGDAIRAIHAIDPAAKVEQAKEKFGELRIYLSRHDERTAEIADAASRESRVTCQTCAAPAELMKTHDGLYATLCENHAEGFSLAATRPMISFRMIKGGKLKRIDVLGLPHPHDEN